jgi:hypothetical protein
MTKPFIKPVAAAVSLALISVSAHAGLTTPSVGSTAPASNGLYLSVWDSSGTNSEVVNLSYALTDISLAAGNMTPNSATSPFVETTDPSGGTGTVLQLNFGTISGFSSLFTSTNLSTTDYMVTAAVTGAAGTEEAAVTSTVTPTTTFSGMNTLTQHVQSEVANWTADQPNSGVVTDTTGTSQESVQSGPLGGGNLGLSGQQFGGSVGSALAFYDITTAKSGLKTTATPTEYANSTGNGFWFLSSSGVLSYNVPEAAPVPLPASVWLFGSALLGFAGIGRRRSAV